MVDQRVRVDLHDRAVWRSGQWCIRQSRASCATRLATLLRSPRITFRKRCSERPAELLFLFQHFVLVSCPCAVHAGGGEMAHDGS